MLAALRREEEGAGLESMLTRGETIAGAQGARVGTMAEAGAESSALEDSKVRLV